MYTECSPLFGIFISRNCMYSNSEIKNKHNNVIRSEFSRPIKNVKVLINDITTTLKILIFKVHNIFYNINK